MNKPVSKLYWLWIPVIFMAVQMTGEMILPHKLLEYIHDENGPHEVLQFVVIFIAFIVAVRALFLPELKGRPWLRAWIGLAAVCSFYVAGEEISWGQQFFHWVTPADWAAINDQDETNLHNTSSWLDQKPKMLLEIGVYVGGIIIPLLARFRPKLLPERFTVIYPPSITSVAAFFVFALMVEHKLAQGLHFTDFFTRANEVQELYLYYFVLLYLLILKKRIFNTRSHKV